ncbi:MAG: hypothetical protein C3F18_08675 [Nitrosomonadales bacterium]|nr:MAG: hypothetical protein C3F18_08675 [Nitrosomonadales bacterium]
MTTKERMLIAGCRAVPVDTAMVKPAMTIAEKQAISHWDALIAASAQLAGCDTLWHKLTKNKSNKTPNNFIVAS